MASSDNTTPIPDTSEQLVSLVDQARAGNRSAFAQLADRYDYVIVDTPPLLPVVDANVVAQYLDGTLLVLRAGRSRRPDLIEAADRLRLGNVELLGSVLNCVSGADNRYAYSYHGGVEDGEDSVAMQDVGTRR